MTGFTVTSCYVYCREEFDIMDDLEDEKPRFELYVKKSSTNGGPRGSCPFSLKAYLFIHLVVDEKDFQAHPVDIINKPFYMMKLNPCKYTVYVGYKAHSQNKAHPPFLRGLWKYFAIKKVSITNSL